MGLVEVLIFLPQRADPFTHGASPQFQNRFVCLFVGYKYIPPHLLLQEAQGSTPGSPSLLTTARQDRVRLRGSDWAHRHTWRASFLSGDFNSGLPGPSPTL